MSDIDQVLEIQLEDGRIVVGTPGPEDQPWLRTLGSDTTIQIGSSAYDTAGHAISADIEVDVAGHAMTLRLPTAADAEALRRLLMVSAMSATIVAAGAIASIQPHAVPSADTIVNRGPAPVPAQDFAQRRETQIDEMLGEPPAAAPADNMAIERGQHGGAANLSESSAASTVSAPSVRSGQPSDEFAQQRENAADELLEAPQGAAGSVTRAGGPTHGGPQD